MILPNCIKSSQKMTVFIQTNAIVVNLHNSHCHAILIFFLIVFADVHLNNNNNHDYDDDDDIDDDETKISLFVVLCKYYDIVSGDDKKMERKNVHLDFHQLNDDDDDDVIIFRLYMLWRKFFFFFERRHVHFILSSQRRLKHGNFFL